MLGDVDWGKLIMVSCTSCERHLPRLSFNMNDDQIYTIRVECAKCERYGYGTASDLEYFVRNSKKPIFEFNLHEICQYHIALEDHIYEISDVASIIWQNRDTVQS